ncbi:hypothetical protein Tco_1004465 [Tanacetum coccineum]|uniref:Uncharacterized protein n=1 Tax=Tanacetum coccineum TaxID=301880 RepID=A0ABQ5FCG3_9ASTR
MEPAIVLQWNQPTVTKSVFERFYDIKSYEIQCDLERFYLDLVRYGDVMDEVVVMSVRILVGCGYGGGSGKIHDDFLVDEAVELTTPNGKSAFCRTGSGGSIGSMEPALLQMEPAPADKSTGRSTTAPRGGRTSGRTGRGGRGTGEPTGRVGGRTSEPDGNGGDHGVEANKGVDEVLDFSTVIA